MTTRRIALVAAALLVLQVVGFHSLRHDDAFITYRYGQNIARGRGVTFNPGQRQMLSSAPGHVAASAAIYSLVGQEHTPSVMSALGCAGWIAQAWAVLLLARMAFPNLGAVFMALAIALGAAWSQRFVALETNLAAAGVLWALVASLRRHHRAAFALAAAAGLLRPDAFLVLLPVAVGCLRDRGWHAWKPAVLAAAISAPWVVFSALYFGTVLPSSYAAKVQTVAPGAYAEAVAHYAASLVLGRPELQIPQFVAPGVTGLPLTVLAVAVWGGAAAGAVLWIRRHRQGWVLPATGLLYLVAYLLLRARIGMEWHLYPVMLVLAILLLALLVEGMLWLHSRPYGRVAAVVCMVALLGGLTWRTARSARDHRRAFWYGARHDAYRAIARELKRRAHPGDVVLVGEIGTLAYYTDLQLADTGGLIRTEPGAPNAPRTRRWAVSVVAYPLSPCPLPPVLRAASSPVSTSELRPRGHTRFVALLCDLRQPAVRDRTAPRVTHFRLRVSRDTGAVAVHWAASDNQELWRVELWRAPDLQGRPDAQRWKLVPAGVRVLTGKQSRGELGDTPPPGHWWYGVHVLDRARNIGHEPAPRLARPRD